MTKFSASKINELIGEFDEVINQILNLVAQKEKLLKEMGSLESRLVVSEALISHYKDESREQKVLIHELKAKIEELEEELEEEENDNLDGV